MDVAEAYETVCDEENKEKLKELLVDHEVDIITFTSSSTVFNLVDPVSYTHLDVYKRQGLLC